MADPPHSPDSEPHATPRWVKVFGIVAAVVILLFLIVLLVRGPHRGPSRHLGSGSLGGQATASSVIQAQAAPQRGRP